MVTLPRRGPGPAPGPSTTPKPTVSHPSPARTAVEGRIAAAARAAEAEEAKLVQASGARLSALLRVPAEKRLAMLDDPELVPADQARLRNSLQADLSRPMRVRSGPRRWLPRFKRSPRLFVRALASLGALALFVGVAVSRNAEPATLVDPVAVMLKRADGTRRGGYLPIGAKLTVRRLDDTWARARDWRPGQGYTTFRVPLSALRFER